MAGFNDPKEPPSVKLLLVGDTGSGKTGATMALAAAGYNVRVLDYDSGLRIVEGFIRNPDSPYRRPNALLWPQAPTESELLARYRFETLTDGRKNINGRLIPRVGPGGNAWQRGAKLLDNWTTEDDKFGPVASWTQQEVLVVDTLSFAAKRAGEFVQVMNNRLGQPLQIQDYMGAQQLIESMLGLLYDDGIKCHVVVNCHIRYIEQEGAPRRGFPETIGRALNDQIGRYFNSVLQAKTKGFGATAKHVITTVGDSVVELKTPAPLSVKKEYDLGTGLAEYFRDVRNAPAKGTTV
jgi:hypothetical protein